ncbi:ATP-binding protein [Candidatus Viridilinea mediisalina]|uniref:ATP-binding protein n=1 Tax=Candidatus Viridilinea mediisalina TaxID=2024553 RepID=UPI001FE7BFAA|nr:ATP-binding protein [Candidatus Viridilinea mediisalina]
MRQHIEVPGEWASISTLLAFTDSLEACEVLSHEQCYLLRLVIEEIATNIVKYGYIEQPPGPIQVTCEYHASRLAITIRDRGRPFDPRDHPLPDFTSATAERSIGGLGLYFVCEMADDVHYHHDPTSGWNELIVTKAST